MKGKPLEEMKPLCRQASAESAVLLRNRGGFLPIKKEDTVALFGRCSVNYHRCGTGSGGNVNVTYSTNLMDGLKSYPWVRLDEELLKIYLDWVSEHPFDAGNGQWASEPWHQVEMKIDPLVVKASAKRSNKAIIVIGRTAGEDKDNFDGPGSYRLTSDEKHLITLVTSEFEHVGVIFNVSNIMDTAWVDEIWCHGHIDGILYCWQGGPEGGNALADVLTGAVNPSGKLTDTICYRLSDYPSDRNHGDRIQNYYEEDVYVGYRYTESFAPETVMFPFGFGLSYTEFLFEEIYAKAVDPKAPFVSRKFEVLVKVRNVGKVKGATVVQVYLTAPNGKLGRPLRELKGFRKTSELEPGSCETVKIVINAEEFAAYDDSGISGHKSCYVLEQGDYALFAGSDVKNLTEALCDGKHVLTINETLVVRELEEAMTPSEGFTRIRAVDGGDGQRALSSEAVPTEIRKLSERIAERLPKEIPFSGKNCTLQEVEAGTATLEEFVAQLTQKQLAIIVRGEGMSSAKATPGTASVFGGVSDDLMKLGIPAVCCADGPSGIHMEASLKATQIPIGTALACTWNPELVEELYRNIGKEMREDEVDCLLGPGINIHRHPLCGRNFEYYSEDPFVAGKMAVSAVKGVAANGCEAVIKHCCANSQEAARHTVNSVVSERALREIYLKPFEMSVKEGDAHSIMTSYNLVNGHYTAASYDLTTTVIRNEWGFDGMVMTDWWSRLNDVEEGGELSFTDFRSMVRAQNDVYMIVNNNAAATNAKGDNTEASVDAGKLTKAELQRCALNILRLVLRLPAMKRPIILPPSMPVEPSETSEIAVMALGKNEISEDTIVSKPFYVEITEEDDYILNMGVSSTSWELAQVLSTLYIGNEKVGDIQTNGTGGAIQELLVARIHFKPGKYALRVEHIQPKIDLHYVKIEKRYQT